MNSLPRSTCNRIPVPCFEPALRVVFRYDDICATSSLDLERKLIAAFAGARAQLTVGVIPFVCASDYSDPLPQDLLPLTPAKVQLLGDAAAAGHVEIALHGYSHQAQDRLHGNEFAGLSRAEQASRIRVGCDELQSRLGTHITTFIPPWNVYDQTTLDVLAASELQLSAGLRGPFPAHGTTRFLPATCFFEALPDLLRAARPFWRLSPTIVVLLHPFDFFESGSPLATLTTSQLAVALQHLTRLRHVRVSSVRRAWDDGVALPANDLTPYYRWKTAIQQIPFRFRVLLQDQVLWVNRSAFPVLLPVTLLESYVSTHRLIPDLIATSRRKLHRFFVRGLFTYPVTSDVLTCPLDVPKSDSDSLITDDDHPHSPPPPHYISASQ